MKNAPAIRKYIGTLCEGVQPNSNTGIPGLTLAAIYMMLQEKLSIYQMVEDFHNKFGIQYSGPPRMLEANVFKHRKQTMKEELKEYEDACALYEMSTTPEEKQKTLEDIFDALIDLMYFALGTAHLHGFHRFDEGFARVHEANMKKELSSPENPGKRSLEGGDFVGIDIVKPKDWVPPTLTDLL